MVLIVLEVDRSATTKIYDDITSKGSKRLVDYCSICNRKKIITVSDNTVQAEGLCSFFSNFWERFLLKLVKR